MCASTPLNKLNAKSRLKHLVVLCNVHDDISFVCGRPRVRHKPSNDHSKPRATARDTLSLTPPNLIQRDTASLPPGSYSLVWVGKTCPTIV